MKSLKHRIIALEGSGVANGQPIDLSGLSDGELGRLRAIKAALDRGHVTIETMETDDLRFIAGLPIKENAA